MVLAKDSVMLMNRDGLALNELDADAPVVLPAS